MLKPIKTILLSLSVLLIACASGDIKPVPIEYGDMCSFCRMAISEKQFASQIITPDERVHKFDDIGCLLRFRKTTGDQAKEAAIFVTDHDSHQWLRAEKAFFVRSTSVKTPMGSGILAYGDQAKAGDGSMTFAALTASGQ
ncbi:MAG: nitrous oxide reductase accessory protein NosL [Acidobacteria bacterium]|nr:nitrous oxide reductase accessory protein NosL [Acidobacteriota bacterium]